MRLTEFFIFSIISHLFPCFCDSPFYHEPKNLLSNKFAPEPNYSQLNLEDAKEFFNRKNCGKSLKHLGGLLLDKSDKDSKLIVEGSVIANKLVLKIGNFKEKEISVSNIILPIETLSKKCINIRQTKIEDSAVLCLSTTVMRNFWINSITDAVLCHLTKVNGKLPEYNYLNEEDEKEEKKKEVNENEVKVNEKEVEVTEKEKEKEKEVDVEVKEKEKEKESEVKEKQSEVKEKQSEVKEKQSEVKEKQSEVKEKQSEVKEKQSELKEKQSEVKEKGPEIKEKEPEIKEKEIEQKVENMLETKGEVKPVDQAEEGMKKEKEKEKKDEDEEIRKKILREEFDDDVGNKEEERGLKLRIAKSKYGYAKVKINGKSIEEIKKNEELERTLKDEEKDLATRTVEDLYDMDEIDDF